MAQVAALVDDLFFQAKIMETAKLLGVQLKTFGTGPALLTEVLQTPPRLVIIDLNARQGAIEAIEQLHASAASVPIVAFLSHVQTELAARAKAAGCRDVMPRSLFTTNLAKILTSAQAPEHANDQA
ncbi:MAG: response regulator [Candidatus Acidiferrales bacterium]|jgi:DNA-binding NarL/FixJ family response regulator